MNIFDRSLKSIHRNRIIFNSDHSTFFFNELGVKSIINRLKSIVQKQYTSCCFIGPMSHLYYSTILSQNFLGMKALTIVDNCQSSLNYSLSQIPKNSSIKVVGICLDEEQWAFPENYFDLILNNLQLHWINQVHGTLEKFQNSLKPDGTLLGVTLGGDSLQELRIALALAEQEREGGVSTHVSPMLHITDIGQALIRLKYTLVTANADLNVLYFDDIFALMYFLQAVGENNAAIIRRNNVSRDTFIAANAIYKHLFTEKSGEFQGKVSATFELIHYIG